MTGSSRKPRLLREREPARDVFVGRWPPRRRRAAGLPRGSVEDTDVDLPLGLAFFGLEDQAEHPRSTPPVNLAFDRWFDPSAGRDAPSARDHVPRSRVLPCGAMSSAAEGASMGPLETANDVIRMASGSSPAFGPVIAGRELLLMAVDERNMDRARLYLGHARNVLEFGIENPDPAEYYGRDEIEAQLDALLWTGIVEVILGSYESGLLRLYNVHNTVSEYSWRLDDPARRAGRALDEMAAGMIHAGKSEEAIMSYARGATSLYEQAGFPEAEAMSPVRRASAILQGARYPSTMLARRPPQDLEEAQRRQTVLGSEQAFELEERVRQP